MRRIEQRDDGAVLETISMPLREFTIENARRLDELTAHVRELADVVATIARLAVVLPVRNPDDRDKIIEFINGRES